MEDIDRSERGLKISDLCGRVSAGESTIRRWIESGAFPRPNLVVKASGSMRSTSVRWLESEINHFLSGGRVFNRENGYEKVLTLSEVSKRVSAAESTIRLWIKEDKFPRPSVVISSKVKNRSAAVRWLERDIDDFLRGKTDWSKENSVKD